MAGALEGLRIVELGSGIATAYAARLLGDLGADVVKVEPAGGDPLRSSEPRLGDGTSLLFELCNWGKRSVAGDAGELLAAADAVIATPEGLPAPPAELLARHPGLVVTTVAGFGMTGPLSAWQATDLILQATGGIMQISGTSDREPLKHGLQQALWCGGLNAASATLAALRTGAGGHVDLSLQEVVASELVINEANYAFMGAVQGRRPPGGDPLAGEPLPAADGWVSLQTSGLISADRLATLFGDERLADPRFATSESRTQHAGELQAILAEHLAHERGRDFFLRASREGFLAGFVQTPADLLECPQLAARGVWHAFDDLPGVRFPAPVASLSVTPSRVSGRAPAAGADTGSVGWEPRPARAAQDQAPLAGVRVVDLSTVFAVPYLGGLLADLGAEVIKIEAPHRLDQTRALFGHPFAENDPTGEWWDRSGPFHVVNRGKRSVTLDLSQPEGRDVLRELLVETDVLLDNFTPRVLRGWGMTADVLHDLFPGLVTLSNTGYGSTGPWAPFRAQGTSLEATMGISHLTGYAGGKPSKVGQSYPDFVACWSGLVAVLAALAHRDRTGEGQHIDLGMYQLGVVVMPEALLQMQAHGGDMPRRGNEDLGAVASGLVRAAGQDRWLAVSVSADARAALPGVLGADPGEDLMGAIAVWARDREAGEAATALQAAGIAAGPVLDASDLLTDAHLRARGFYEVVDLGPPCGRRPIIGRPYRMEGVGVAGPGPLFGEGNDAILRGLLGFDDARIAALRELGVIADAPTGVPTALTPIDLDVQLASRSMTRVDADYRDVLASDVPVG
jgi:crotonobetainyl-CoA:carnitine CoA-transferase CaiB-like acyl-CoA transferase